MRQEPLKEILKPKKAMIDSVEHELMQQIRPQSASSSASNCRAYAE